MKKNFSLLNINIYNFTSNVPVVLGTWSSGMILASGARGREFDSPSAPRKFPPVPHGNLKKPWVYSFFQLTWFFSDLVCSCSIFQFLWMFQNFQVLLAIAQLLGYRHWLLSFHWLDFFKSCLYLFNCSTSCDVAIVSNSIYKFMQCFTLWFLG